MEKVSTILAAVELYSPAATHRKPGVMFECGNGANQYYARLVELYTLSADQGDAQALWYLGSMYKEGKGVEQDSAISQELCNLAKDRGYFVVSI